MHQSTIILFIVILFSFFSLGVNSKNIEQVSTIKEFETDYCTMFPNGTVFNPELWKHCCYQHDLKYWSGGTELEQTTVDSELKNCVKTASNSFYAFIIYQGVRIGHYSPVKHKTKWGWGWAPERKFIKNSERDIELISKKLEKIKK